MMPEQLNLLSPEPDPLDKGRYTHWIGVRPRQGQMPEVYDATPNRWIPVDEWARWCPSVYPKRATGWRMATMIEVTT
jgi:hypothetical protein